MPITVVKNGQVIAQSTGGLTRIQALVKAVTGQLYSPTIHKKTYLEQIQEILPDAQLIGVTGTKPKIIDGKDIWEVRFV
jgi:hypothetical protein